MPENGRFLFVAPRGLQRRSAHAAPRNQYRTRATDPSHPRASYIEGKRCGEAPATPWPLAAGRRTSRGSRSPTVLARARTTRYQQPDPARHSGERDRPSRPRTRTPNHLYVTDAVAMLLSILPEARGEVTYNVTGASSVTIGDMARAIGRDWVRRLAFLSMKPGLRARRRRSRLDLGRDRGEFGKPSFVPFERWTCDAQSHGSGSSTLSWPQPLKAVQAREQAHDRDPGRGSAVRGIRPVSGDYQPPASSVDQPDN